MTKYYQWHLQAGVEKTVPFLVERSVLDERLPNYANATSIKFDTVPVPLNKLATATLVSTTNSSNKIYAYYTDDAQTQLVFAPKGEGVTIYAPVNCYRLFYNLTSVKQIDFSNFDTSNVTDMSYMFYYCRPLTSLDLSGFDTSNVTNMSYMFRYCRALTSFTVGNNFTMDNVVSYSGYLSNTGRDVPSYNSSYVYKSNGRRYSRTSKLPNGANTYYTYQR